MEPLEAGIYQRPGLLVIRGMYRSKLDSVVDLRSGILGDFLGKVRCPSSSRPHHKTSVGHPMPCGHRVLVDGVALEDRPSPPTSMGSIASTVYNTVGDGEIGLYD